MISVRELEWLAGFLEGEGSFSWNRSGNGGTLRVEVWSIDEDVVARSVKLVGAKIMRRVLTPREGIIRSIQPQFGWVLYGKHAAGLMMTLYSLMGARRKEQIKRALAIWKAAPGHGYKIRDGKRVPANS